MDEGRQWRHPFRNAATGKRPHARFPALDQPAGGGKNEAVRKRFEMLGVKEIHLGVSTKKERLQEWIDNGKIDPSTTVYMGDDIPDFWVMQMVAMGSCPADAAFEIRNISDYISPFKGGQGCVRDLLEQTLKLKKMWMDDESTSW
jgi:3-deoxy-D-manno-octulosonate 8-phosphate phosphatase (KDO 8-P phosphatase)